MPPSFHCSAPLLDTGELARRQALSQGANPTAAAASWRCRAAAALRLERETERKSEGGRDIQRQRETGRGRERQRGPDLQGDIGAILSPAARGLSAAA